MVTDATTEFLFASPLALVAGSPHHITAGNNRGFPSQFRSYRGNQTKKARFRKRLSAQSLSSAVSYEASSVRNLNAIDTLKLNHKQKMIYNDSLRTRLPGTLLIGVAIAAAFATSTCRAAVVLHTTFGENVRNHPNGNSGFTLSSPSDSEATAILGYDEHFRFSTSENAYKAVGEITSGADACSATWIGNDANGAWLLTAAHCSHSTSNTLTFNDWEGNTTSTAGSWTRFDHPMYVADSGGEALFDIALLLMDGVNLSISDGGVFAPAAPISQPVLYGGNAEQGELVTWVGYGFRGTGLLGQQDDIRDGVPGNVPDEGDLDGDDVGNWGAGRAAAQNIIDTVRDDSDIELNFDFDHPDNTPHELEGHLSSGDSGGGAFITVGGAQVLAGVVSESGDERYVNGMGAGENALTRVSSARTFITNNFAGARFTAVPEPSSFLFIGLSGVLMGLRQYMPRRCAMVLDS